jgi:Glycosyl hydrolases family 39
LSGGGPHGGKSIFAWSTPLSIMNRILINAGILAPLLVTLSALTGDVTKLVPGSQPIPASFFGMHIHHMVSPDGARPLTPWPGANIPEWRLWDARVTWPDIEPTKGVWRFDTLDKSLRLAQEHNAEVILTLGLTPRWASARPQEPSGYQPGFAAEPTDLEDWRTFVWTVATRYKGRIHIYEIWNEPNLKQTWTGSIDQMLALVREASRTIRAVDPQATIVSPSATSGIYGVKWLSEFLRKGGGQYVDVIGHHFYVGDQPPEAMVPLIQQIQQVMRDNGVGSKPLWNTESGWFKPNPFPSDELGAAYLARAYILNWSAGVQRFYWFAWDNRHMMIETTEADDKTPKPAGRAFGVVQEWLIGARMDWCSQDTDNTWICQLNRNGELQWIVWNPGDAKTITIPSSWHAKSITPLLGGRNTLSGPTFDAGPVPALITASSQ